MGETGAIRGKSTGRDRKGAKVGEAVAGVVPFQVEVPGLREIRRLAYRRLGRDMEVGAEMMGVDADAELASISRRKRDGYAAGLAYRRGRGCNDKGKKKKKENFKHIHQSVGQGNENAMAAKAWYKLVNPESKRDKSVVGGK